MTVLRPMLNLYFCAGGHAEGLSSRTKLLLIKVLSLSATYHVAIGYDGGVVNPTMEGVFCHPQDQFEAEEAYLSCCVTVPTKHRIDPGYFDHWRGRPISPWPSIFRWIRRGRGPLVYDCTCIALACLDAAGIDVPFTIVTPAQLLKWLRSKGYPCLTKSDLARSRQALGG